MNRRARTLRAAYLDVKVWLFRHVFFWDYYRLHFLYFTVVTFFGGVLVWIAEQSSGSGIAFVDAWFMALSAMTVTGLSTVDFTALTNFSIWLIWLLIILGGQVAFAMVPLLFRKYQYLWACREKKRGWKDVVQPWKLMPPSYQLRAHIENDNLFEYHAVNTMIKIICGYYTLVHLTCFTILIVYGYANTRTRDIIVENEAEPWSFALFHTVSAFNNAGLTIVSLVDLNTSAVVLLAHCVLIVCGNTLFPVLLRGLVMLLKAYYQWQDHDDTALQHILTFPRLYTTHLFTTADTLYLLIVWIITTSFQWVLYTWLPTETPYPEELKYKMLQMFFTTISTRTAGFNCIDLNILNSGILVLQVLLMYLSSYPFIVAVKSSGNVKIPLHVISGAKAQHEDYLRSIDKDGDQLSAQLSQHNLDHHGQPGDARQTWVSTSSSAGDNDDISSTMELNDEIINPLQTITEGELYEARDEVDDAEKDNYRQGRFQIHPVLDVARQISRQPPRVSILRKEPRAMSSLTKSFSSGNHQLTHDAYESTDISEMLPNVPPTQSHRFNVYDARASAPFRTKAAMTAMADVGEGSSHLGGNTLPDTPRDQQSNTLSPVPTGHNPNGDRMASLVPSLSPATHCNAMDDSSTTPKHTPRPSMATGTSNGAGDRASAPVPSRTTSSMDTEDHVAGDRVLAGQSDRVPEALRWATTEARKSSLTDGIKVPMKTEDSRTPAKGNSIPAPETDMEYPTHVALDRGKSTERRALLANDMLWLAVSIFLVSLFDNMMDICDLFRLIFEVVSAYGTVGLSLSTPDDTGSFVSGMSAFSKLVIMAVMMSGRHRGLPHSLDSAVTRIKQPTTKPQSSRLSQMRLDDFMQYTRGHPTSTFTVARINTTTGRTHTYRQVRDLFPTQSSPHTYDETEGNLDTVRFSISDSHTNGRNCFGDNLRGRFSMQHSRSGVNDTIMYRSREDLHYATVGPASREKLSGGCIQ